MANWKPPTIGDRPVIVFGARVMGRRISCVWTAAGYNVNIQDLDLKERAEAVQYVIEHVAGYMKRIGSTTKGIITANENTSTPNASNPWLVIEALPDLLPAKERLALKESLLGDLEAFVPDECIIAMNSTARSRIFLRKVNLPHRILNLHHYLVPNVRVVEIVQNEYTELAIVKFLCDIVPKAGALPIIARNDKKGMPFQLVWESIKHEVIGRLGKNIDSAQIDNAWESILRNSPTQDLKIWFNELGLEFDAMMQRDYVIGIDLGRPPLAYLEELYINEGTLAPLSPYDGLELHSDGLAARLSEPLQRAGPDVYYVDVGLGDDSDIGTPDMGKILCGSTDGTVRTVRDRMLLPYGLAIHLGTRKIYWGDLADCTISCCNADGSNVQLVVPKNGRNAPNKLAIDETASQLYWTTTNNTQILRCNLDGSDIRVILENTSSPSRTRESMHWLNGLALDPSKRHIYWSEPSPDLEKKCRILRASMDLTASSATSQREEIEVMFDDLPEILDMDFAPVFEELYWSSRGEDGRPGTEIHRGYVGACANADMVKRDVVVGSLKGRGWLKLDPKGGHVYTTCLKGEVARYDMMSGEGQCRLYRDKSGAFMGIALMDAVARRAQGQEHVAAVGYGRVVVDDHDVKIPDGTANEDAEGGGVKTEDSEVEDSLVEEDMEGDVMMKDY